VSGALPTALLQEGAPAKINLNLLITGRRPDGYHLLDSLVVFAGACDQLTVMPSDRLTLTVGGAFAGGLGSEADNLVLRAARALASAHGIQLGARLHLEKNLPVASGIGGGSSDAAAALRLLARLWGVGVPISIAASLGADVPVCLEARPCRMSGVGEILGPAPEIPACGIALVNPGLPLATAQVFRARQGPFSPPAVLPQGWSDVADMAACLAGSGNDLEAAAIGLCPAIAEVLGALRRHRACRLARMSGSGATCFALFDTPAQARDAALALAQPRWWCWGGALWLGTLRGG
jgi:4-diphosphocytidyl-2-C-methyl-D-erythritol kinase